MMIGTTISFAGNPRINANKMTPSIPRRCANGSRNSEQWASNVISPTVILASNHRMSPAGAATLAARPSTNNVLSNKDRMITFPTCGLRYGGSSKVKEEGTPFNMVLDNKRDTRKVMNTPNKMTAVSKSVEAIDWSGPAKEPAKNIVMIAMSVGNRPLQGTKLLVIIAISRSLGESMIRHPTIPAALHPNPIHMVKACFPQA